MLVCVREVDKSELANRHRKRIAAPHFERYYSLYTSETGATIVDVVDSRARKTFNYDVCIRSPAALQEQVVEPLLMTVLTPDRASQATVVIDGLAGNRFSALMDTENGVLASTARAAATHPDVASLSFSAVTLEDNNILTDILLPEQRGVSQEVTILEDTHDQFTSVEDAHYVSLESEDIWGAVLQRVTSAFTEYKHHIFSFIFSFHAATGRPNTTMQFVSFTVNEVARGMKSSRHAVSSAAGLIECNSPTLTFTATKLLYLLKPSLLGQQPGAWVACFSPVSVVEVAERETFQEAFAVAQTASRLYCSRIALLNASAALLPPPSAVSPLHPPPPLTSSRSGISIPGAVEDVADTADFHSGRPPSAPLPSRGGNVRVSQEAQTNASFSHDDSSSFSPAAAARASTPHLVDTPAEELRPRQQRVAVSATTTMAGAPSPLSQHSAVSRRSAGVSTAVQTDTALGSASAHPRESIQRGSSEEPSAVRYEFDTYRAVMERAMAQLRNDMRRCIDQLEETREEMRAQRKQSRELRRELEMANESRHATVLENSELRQELNTQQRQYQQKVQELSQLSSASFINVSASPSGRQLADRAASEATRALRDEIELLEVRVSELTELVAFHQSEITNHVSKENTYRQRILDLEAALREKERAVISSRAVAQEARRAVDAATARPTPLPTATAVAVTEPLHSRTSSAVLRDDVRDFEDRAAEVELHLRTALDELQRERTQRLQLENLLKQREAEVAAEAVDTRGAAATEAVVQALRQTYEKQLRELRAEMSGFRDQLGQQVPRPSSSQPAPQHSTSPPASTLSSSNESSRQAPTPPVARVAAAEQLQGQPRPLPRPPTPLRMSPVPEGSAGTVGNGTNNNTSSVQSQGGSARPSPSRRNRRTQSFEEYMEEEPHYELHRASFVRPRPRTAM
jgi:hypothetical protein